MRVCVRAHINVLCACLYMYVCQNMCLYLCICVLRDTFMSVYVCAVSILVCACVHVCGIYACVCM